MGIIHFIRTFIEKQKLKNEIKVVTNREYCELECMRMSKILFAGGITIDDAIRNIHKANSGKQFGQDYSSHFVDETSSKALRYNSGKPQWTLLHFASLLPLVEVLEFGAKKYARNNWKKDMDPLVILDSLTRHLTALIDGEECDKESGLPHIGHIMANAMFYSYHSQKLGKSPQPKK